MVRIETRTFHMQTASGYVWDEGAPCDACGIDFVENEPVKVALVSQYDETATPPISFAWDSMYHTHCPITSRKFHSAAELAEIGHAGMSGRISADEWAQQVMAVR